MIGYTAGVWDLFHVGHLRLLQRVRGLCDTMIVGVSVDELVEKVKGKRPTFPFHERLEIINGLGIADAVVPQYDIDKINAKNKIKFDVLFVGDDHYEESDWKKYEEVMEVVYLPYTKSVSTSAIIKRIHDQI